MTESKHAPGYVPNPNYTQEEWDEVCDNPELTAEDFAEMRPVAETMPEFVTAMHNRRTGVVAAAFSLRIDQDVLEAYQATGPGWQSRMNEALRKAVGL